MWSFRVFVSELCLSVMDFMSLLMLLSSDFFSEGEVGEVVGKIASVYFDAVDLECVFLEGDIVRNVDWLGLLCDFYIIYL